MHWQLVEVMSSMRLAFCFKDRPTDYSMMDEMGNAGGGLIGTIRSMYGRKWRNIVEGKHVRMADRKEPSQGIQDFIFR